MPRLTLALAALYLALAVGGRALLQWRRTGSTGIRGLARSGAADWAAGALLVGGMLAGLAAPILALAGWLPPPAALDRPSVRLAGVALFAAGLLGTLAAQLAMGASWRIGVDPSEKTALVTRGPFAVVRNPIYSAMLPALLGLALTTPSLLALAAWVAEVTAIELQVRFVEEPYLASVHGAAFADYCARVGRFVPWLGRSR